MADLSGLFNRKAMDKMHSPDDLDKAIRLASPGIAMDGKTVSKSGNNYTVKEGSLVLTLKARYLNTLSIGEHKVTISFTDGSAETTLKILPPAPPPKPVPKTGDGGHPALWLGLILLGQLTIGGTLVLSRRKRG